jgi:hypothetical protein
MDVDDTTLDRLLADLAEGEREMHAWRARLRATTDGLTGAELDGALQKMSELDLILWSTGDPARTKLAARARQLAAQARRRRRRRGPKRAQKR